MKDTLLHFATLEGQNGIVAYMIEKEADMEATNSAGVRKDRARLCDPRCMLVISHNLSIAVFSPLLYREHPCITPHVKAR